jgi:glyoxalase family protein
MQHDLPGLHHVTAIAGDPQRNVDFYTGVLGLRLVKITINYDDPGSYHFYYGDEAGSPGSILTFFAWPGGYRGARGTSQATVTSFSVPEGGLDYWQQRFAAHSIPFEPPVRRWDEEALTFYDPDGLQLELVAHSGAEERAGWNHGSIPPEYALRGFHSVTLALRDSAPTATLLTDTLGFRLLREEGNRSRYAAGEQGTARTVDLLTLPQVQRGAVGVGTVHHIAWRTPTDAQQQTWQELLATQRVHVSPIMDRQYFHSIYFREPGGVLFEIATDLPGFTTDEPLAQLGSSLRLPNWLEPQRDRIQKGLLPLVLPQTTQEEA